MALCRPGERRVLFNKDDPMATTVILARHGHTPWNFQGKIQGHSDRGLDQKGRCQSVELATELLSKSVVDNGLRIISSDLLRAVQTACLVKKALHLPADIEMDERLRECCFGTLEGMTRKQIVDTYGHEWNRHLTDRGFAYNFRQFGGEYKEEVIRRQARLLAELRDHPASTVLLVGHGRSLNSLIQYYWSHLEPINHNCEYRIINL